MRKYFSEGNFRKRFTYERFKNCIEKFKKEETSQNCFSQSDPL